MSDGNLGALLSASTVRARVHATSWEEAVDEAGRLLVAAGACESRYTDAMRAAVTEFGPYIVISPGVAMPHARPEHGVLRPGIALLTLAKPVEFGHPANDPVDLVIPFAAVDKDAHIATLQRISALLLDAPALARVRKARTDGDLRAALSITDDTATTDHPGGGTR